MSNIILKPSQEKVLDSLVDFIDDPSKRIYVLKGYAGTGKTTLVRFLIEKLNRKQKGFLLLASTGRAAKILSNLTSDDSRAQTIHSLIYKFKDFNQDVTEVTEEKEPDGQLYLVFEPAIIKSNDETEMVYIVDESSMISDEEVKDVIQAKFGTGKLLSELLNYDSRSTSKFIFVGDPCQLPPVLGNFSPALDKEYMSRVFEEDVQESQLTEIIRQKGDNTIIVASKKIRTLWSNAPDDEEFYGKNVVWGKFPFRGCREIKLHENYNLMMDDYFRKIQNGNYNSATYICRSNKSCTEISNIIRNRLGFYSKHVQPGDLLMVIQNNISGLMNGDMVKVLTIDSYVEIKAHLSFRKIQVEELFTHKKYSILLLEDTLGVNQLNLNSKQQKKLFVEFIVRMKKKGITQKQKAEFDDAMYNDVYLNALRCTFGYAITCHKAQGGEWEDVYVDVPRNITKNPTKETYQWMYTAMTRTKNQFHMVNDFYFK